VQNALIKLKAKWQQHYIGSHTKYNSPVKRWQ